MAVGKLSVHNACMQHIDMSTEEEVQLSTPYSDAAAWEVILTGEYLRGDRRLQGPPGLWESVAARVQVDGLVATRERYLEGKK